MQRLSSGQHPRPWFLWGFSLLVILLGAANLLLAFDQARHADQYRDLGVSYPPLLRAAFALGWGLALVLAGIELARRRPWARRWILIVLSNYGAFRVLWLMVYAQSDYSRGRIVFKAALAAGLIGLVVWIMRGRRVRRAFEQHPAGVSGLGNNAETSGEAFNDKPQD
ncbi:MAG: hypothetical protein EHM39_05995 [Chloroflexi bacterium]|nr:MAG: hypothetical protein EHM39_05995 [Chloroflexota bacterium]